MTTTQNIQMATRYEVRPTTATQSDLVMITDIEGDRWTVVASGPTEAIQRSYDRIAAATR